MYCNVDKHLHCDVGKSLVLLHRFAAGIELFVRLSVIRQRYKATNSARNHSRSEDPPKSRSIEMTVTSPKWLYNKTQSLHDECVKENLVSAQTMRNPREPRICAAFARLTCHPFTDWSDVIGACAICGGNVFNVIKCYSQMNLCQRRSGIRLQTVRGALGWRQRLLFRGGSIMMQDSVSSHIMATMVQTIRRESADWTILSTEWISQAAADLHRVARRVWQAYWQDLAPGRSWLWSHHAHIVSLQNLDQSFATVYSHRLLQTCDH